MCFTSWPIRSCGGNSSDSISDYNSWLSLSEIRNQDQYQDQDQDAHLTRPHVGVGRVANHVALPSHQLVELGVYR